MMTIQSFSSFQYGGIGGKSPGGLVGTLLISCDHRAKPIQDQPAEDVIVVTKQQSVSLDYCLRWNNASEKIIIEPSISPYRRFVGATRRDSAHSGYLHGIGVARNSAPVGDRNERKKRRSEEGVAGV